ncbi:MAG: glycosyltransferase [Bacteroidetes bacterium]|nr:glycosyltransferase [Bacteroidota bacterium]
MNNKLIVVLGMHRSGTSAITRGLQILGVQLGENLHPAGFDNPKGFWEDRDFLGINEALLHRLGSAYDRLGLAWSDFDNDSVISALKNNAIQLLSQKLAENQGIFGFKDPRTCRLLGFWRSVFKITGCEVFYVIALRSPLSVALSLTTRNNIPFEKSCILWLQHMVPAVTDSAGSPRIVVDYDLLMDNPLEQLKRISSRFTLMMDDENSPIVNEYVNDFLEKGLRHSISTEAELLSDRRIPPDVVEAYELLLQAAKDNISLKSKEFTEHFEALAERLNAFSTVFSYANSLEDERVKRDLLIINLNQQLAKQEQQNQDKEKLISLKNEDLNQKNEDLNQKNEDLNQYKEKLSQKKEELYQKDQTLNHKNEELSNYNVLLQEKEKVLQDFSNIILEKESLIITKDHDIFELSHSNLEKDKLIQEKERELFEAWNSIQEKDTFYTIANEKLREASYIFKKNERTIQNHEQKIDALYKSYSWKISKPFRWLFPRMLTFFYFFCPYGSKRWLIVKTFLRILAHPGFYVKIINTKNISEYIKILTNANLITYNQGIESKNLVSENIDPTLLLHNITMNTENNLVIPNYSTPTVLFYYVSVYSEERLFNSVSSIIRNTMVPFKIIVAENSKHLNYNSIQNIESIEIYEVLHYLSKYPAIKYICLLDCATLIRPDTITTCVSTLEIDNDFSMVVPAILDNHGMLESAGSILWSDGSYSLLGNSEDPYKPEFLYLRETDTGNHFAMVRNEVFCHWFNSETMAFNTWPYPIHDLSMVIRGSHAKVIYQPKAQVVNISQSIEILPETISLFYNKWKDQLLNDHVPDAKENYFVARERGQGKQYMLMIDHYVPTFDKDAGSRTMKSYMELFLENNIILKFLGDNFNPEEKYVNYFQQKGIEILHGEYYEKNWLQWLKKYGNLFNYVFLSRPAIAIKYIDILKESTNAKIFFYGHDLHYLREFRQYQLEKKEELLKGAMKSKEIEQKLFEFVDFIYYPSQAEIDIIYKEFKIKGKARKIVPYIFDEFLKPDYHFDERKDILFVGGFYHQPNCDAMLWFLVEIFPAINKSIPGIKLYIAGSNPTEEIKSKVADNIIVTGYLSDEELKQLYKKCRLVVAPLRFGAGIKGKIVEAMYCGLPVITTSIGAEGLTGSETLLTIADNAEDFAQQVTLLYSDEKILKKVSLDSFEYVKANFSKEKAYSIIRQDLVPCPDYFNCKPIPSAKILFVSHDANLGGAQFLLLSMLRWFKAHTAIDIRIMCNNGGILLDKFKEITETIVYSDLENTYQSKKERESVILTFCNGIPDLIYGNTVAAGKSYSLLKAFGVPILTHVHELQMSIDHYAGDFIDDVIRNSQFFIAASNAVAENLNNSLKIEQGKIKVIYEYIEDVVVPSITFKAKTALRRKLGLDEKKFLIFGCGVALFWRKGGDLFIDVANKLKNEGLDNLHFYWIGTFDELEKDTPFGTWVDQLQLIKKWELDKYITFLGRKDNVMEYLRAGDVFLLPSREDPFPLVCLEAAQKGLPVICFRDAGGMPEFVEEDAGFVVPFEDTSAMAERIVTLQNDPELLSRLGNTAKEKVKSRHTISITLPKILSTCRTIAGKNPMISVIVPNYNYGRFLEKRLESISRQTFQDFELIILDDASEDNSLEVINRFSSMHETQMFFNQNNSGSVFKQWYKGLSLAKAEIIWVAEADDLSEPDFLEKMLPLMNDPEVNLAYCNSHVIDDNGLVTKNFYLNTGWYDNLPRGNKWWNSYINNGHVEMNGGLAVKNIIPNANAVLIRKSSILNINTNELFSYRCCGDWYIYMNSIKVGKIAYNSLSLNYQRRHKNSVVGKSVNSASETIPEYFRIHKFAIENFFLEKETFEKQADFVLRDLRGLWPGVKDKVYDGLYDIHELQRCFINKFHPTQT